MAPHERHMSEQSEEQSLGKGHKCAMSAVAAHKEEIASLAPPERLYWWLGFLAAAMGAALASIGEPAFRGLRAALAESRDAQATTIPNERLVSGVRPITRRTYIKGELRRTKKKG